MLCGLRELRRRRDAPRLGLVGRAETFSPRLSEAGDRSLSRFEARLSLPQLRILRLTENSRALVTILLSSTIFSGTAESWSPGTLRQSFFPWVLTPR